MNHLSKHEPLFQYLPVLSLCLKRSQIEFLFVVGGGRVSSIGAINRQVPTVVPGQASDPRSDVRHAASNVSLNTRQMRHHMSQHTIMHQQMGTERTQPMVPDRGVTRHRESRRKTHMFPATEVRQPLVPRINPGLVLQETLGRQEQQPIAMEQETDGKNRLLFRPLSFYNDY